MKILLNIAWRNIWRNRKRSFVIIWAVTFGLWVGIFLTGFYAGLIEQRILMAVSKETSHIQIHHPQCKPDYDLKYPIPQAQAVNNYIQRDEKIKAASLRLVISGMVASASGTAGIIMQGVDPLKENNVTLLCSKIFSGQCLSPLDQEAVLISERLAKKLKLKLHRKLVISFLDRDGDLVSAALKVKGIYRTFNIPYDDANIFIPLPILDSLEGPQKTVNEIAIFLKSGNSLEEVTSSVRKSFPNLKTETWQELSPELGLTVSVGDQMVFIFMGIILLALIFGIVNTMMMAVLERTREIGILMAIGMNKSRIFLLIVLETFFLVLVGSPIGLILGWISVTVAGNTGIDLSAYTGVYSNFGYESVVYPRVSLHDIIQVFAMLAVAAIAASLFPALRSLQIRPAQAIKK